MPIKKMPTIKFNHDDNAKEIYIYDDEVILTTDNSSLDPSTIKIIDINNQQYNITYIVGYPEKQLLKVYLSKI